MLELLKRLFLNTNLFLLSLKDLFTPKMVKFSILPFFISILIVYFLFFIFASIGLSQLDIQNQLQSYNLVNTLMNYTIISYAITFFVYALGSFFMLYLSIFVAVIAIGFLTPYILKELHIRHYKDIKMVGYATTIESVFLVVKWALTMLLLYIVFIPLYIIPLVNIIALHFPLYYFFHKMMTFDVASHITTREEDEEIKLINSTSLWGKTLLLYIISLIPFVIFFASVFFVIYLGHIYFTEVKKLRTN